MTDDRDLRMRLCRDSYAAYCYYVHDGRWIDSAFHRYLANAVQDFIEDETGNPYDVLVISTPPQHGKSMTITETLGSWYIGKYPDKRCIVACYNDDFAGRFGRRNRQKLKEYGSEIFGVSLDRKKSTDRDMEIADHAGSIITRGIMSGITGNAGDLIIIDDPVKNRQEADSETYRRRMWDEWENSIITRTQAGSKIIVIQTRWHEDDLAGRILAREPHVTYINLPVEAEADDPLGREIGEPLCPEIGKDRAWLAEFKARYAASEGSRAWNALYMGHPTVEQGNIINRGWWQYYSELPERLPLISISVDAAFKDTGDYVSIQVWGRCNADFYLLDLINKRMDFTETVEAIRLMSHKYPDYHSILIEDKANGSAIISVLRHELGKIIPITPKESKIARCNAVSGIIEAGNVHLPKYAELTAEFVDQFSAFPNAAHDDMVDACTQFLNRYKYQPANYVADSRTEFDKSLAEWRKKQLRGSKRRRA